MVTSLYGVTFSLRSVLRPLYALLIKFYAVPFSLCAVHVVRYIGGAFFDICRVYCILRGNVSLYEVPISSYMADNFLNAVLSSRRPFSRYTRCFSHCLR